MKFSVLISWLASGPRWPIRAKVETAADCVLIAFVNIFAWLVNVEQLLKVAVLLISAGFMIHRWWYWNRTKDRRGSRRKAAARSTQGDELIL